MLKKISKTFGVLLLSRIVGTLRELIISAAFGFSRVTDLFYQSTFPITGMLTITNGPFTTAFGARLNQVPFELRVSHIIYYNKVSIYIGLALSAVNICATLLFLVLHNIAPPGISLPLFILTPAFFNMCYAGFVYAVATALGELTIAALVLFINNAAFVLSIIFVWLLKMPIQIWLLPFLYSASSFLSLLLAWRCFKMLERRFISQGADADAKPMPLEGLISSLCYAGAETAVFLVTQFVVLWLATRAGAGWASALSLTQRLSFSINGLIIGPLASLIMLDVLNKPSPARRFALSVGGIFTGLCLFSLVLVFSAKEAIALLVRSHHFHGQSGDILSVLLPSYGVWLLALGTNIPLCRVMFGLKLDKLYTSATVSGYVLANAARIYFASTGSFAAGIAAGGVVELLCVGGLSIFTFSRLKQIERNKPAVQVAACART